MSGFTLVETVVTMAIIGIVTTIIAVAFPVMRHRQGLLLGAQRLEALLRETQQLALNEDRAPACTDQFLGDDESASRARQRCSDVGLLVEGTTVTLFADTDGSKTYSRSRDFRLRDPETLPAAVTGSHTFVSLASPPQLWLYADGVLLDDQHPATLQLTFRQASTMLLVRPLGKVEQQPL